MKEVEKILEKNGWILTCESPLEIEYEKTRDTATGVAAEIIITYLIEDDRDDSEINEFFNENIIP